MSLQPALPDELKRLVGWGAEPRRLALLPALREAAGVTEEMSLPAAGYQVRHYLETQIGLIAEPVEFQGRTIQPETMRRVFRLLLQIEGRGLSAVNRRYRVITLLGVYHSLETWRRPTGPERELCEYLARLMQ